MFYSTYFPTTIWCSLMHDALDTISKRNGMPEQHGIMLAIQPSRPKCKIYSNTEYVMITGVCEESLLVYKLGSTQIYRRYPCRDDE